jgi:hypothetical protein
MKSHTSTASIICGTLILIAPLVLSYFSQREVAHFIATTHAEKISIQSGLPSYYIPSCLIIGIITLGFGIFIGSKKTEQK